jgi:hypothetical protein
VDGRNRPVSCRRPGRWKRLTPLQGSPADQQKAVALTKVLLARADGDPGFERALQDRLAIVPNPIHTCRLWAGGISDIQEAFPCLYIYLVDCLPLAESR